jgi:hypothetical protein
MLFPILFAVAGSMAMFKLAERRAGAVPASSLP